MVLPQEKPADKTSGRSPGACPDIKREEEEGGEGRLGKYRLSHGHNAFDIRKGDDR